MRAYTIGAEQAGQPLNFNTQNDKRFRHRNARCFRQLSVGTEKLAHQEPCIASVAFLCVSCACMLAQRIVTEWGCGR